MLVTTVSAVLLIGGVFLVKFVHFGS